MPTPPIYNPSPPPQTGVFGSAPSTTGFSDSARKGMYLESSLVTSYDTQPGVLSVPLSAPSGGPNSQTQEFIQVNPPVVLKTVAFRYSRVGLYPEVPDPTPGSNEVLLSMEVTPLSPMPVGENGLKAYGVQGTYVFATKVPISPGQGGLKVPRNPVDGDTGRYAITTSNLDQNQT